MVRALSIAALLTALAATTATAQTLPPGAARITRVTDPVLACTLITTSEISKAGGAGVTLGRARTRVEGDVTVVSWRINIDGQRGRKAATCRAEPGFITSVTLGGVELLDQPQPF